MQGLPVVNYRLPIVATLLAALVLLFTIGFITLVALGTSITQIGRFNSGSSNASATQLTFCGIVGLVGVGATLYFLLAVVKGVRDLTTPLFYTRGIVADKKVIGGRKTGNWLRVEARYTGPNLEEARSVNDEERAVSTDRSKIVQPRFGSVLQGSSYLPSDRISGSQEGIPAGRAPRRGADKRMSAAAHTMAESVAYAMQEEVQKGPKAPRVTFRIDPTSYGVLNSDEPVLVAHSRYLEHIFYVARLKDGEWESFRNKALI